MEFNLNLKDKKPKKETQDKQSNQKFNKTTLNNKQEKQKTQKNKLLRFFLAFGLVTAIIMAVYLPLKLTGSLEKISSAEQLKNMILSTGIWGYLTFFALQFVQVTFVPIPAIVTTIAGVLVFGTWHALWISILSVILASAFAFWLGRKFGTKLINWVIGEKEAEKYSKKLEKGKYVFFLMMLFPGFPDDVLCMLAGMTKMSFKFFIITNLITRPLAFVGIVFFGSGKIIPFSGWGIFVWILIVMLMAVSFYISIKKQEEIENFLLNLSNKLKKTESKLKKDKTTKQISNKTSEIIETNETNQTNEADGTK